MAMTKDYEPRKKLGIGGRFSVLMLLYVPQGFTAEPDAPVVYPLGTVYLVLSLLVVLALLFYLVFRWWQRTEQASYLGVIFRDSVFEFELTRRTRRIEEMRNRGEFERLVLSSKDWKKREYPSPPVPDEKLLKYMKPTYSGTGLPGLGSGRIPRGRGSSKNAWDEEEPYYINLDDEELPTEIEGIYQQYKEDKGRYKEDSDKWKRSFDQAVNQEYQIQLDTAHKEANKQALRAADVDMGVFRGRGATFVLEFTAVVVIIFTTAILAILGKLGNEQVGTLLAAIAGYVLGRSVNPAVEKEQKSPGNKNQNPDD